MRNCVLIMFLIFAAAANAASGPAVIEHGPRDSKKLALTFDACPTSRTDEYDEQVISILLDRKVPATLFLSGRWVEKNRDNVRFLAGHPQFEIAQHSYYHPHMTEKDDARDVRELERTQAIIRKITGRTPKYFRPPFAEVDERVAALAARFGLTTIQFDVASGDPDSGLSADRIARGVLRSARGGSIVVFHMNRNGIHTAEALPEVIDGLRSRGYTLVTVGELLQGSREDSAAANKPLKLLVCHAAARFEPQSEGKAR